jgi:hypothetical protein
MQGNEILLTPDAKGAYVEGVISGTPLPGSLMEVVPGQARIGTQLTYRAFSGVSGGQSQGFILLPDQLLGAGPLTAYADGSRCRMYVPLPGDELNVLVGQVSGTGAAVAIGDQLEAQAGSSGAFIPQSGTGIGAYTAQEAIADIGSTTTLVHVRKNS